MTALSPAPGLVNDWFTWTFVAVIFVAVILVWIGASLARIVREDRLNNRYAAMHRHPSARGRCGMCSPTGSPPCTRPGVIWVVDNVTNQAARVCGGHFDEGKVLGWWTQDQPYDQELDRIERLANGDAS